MLNISHILTLVFVLNLLMNNISCERRARLIPRQTERERLLEDAMTKQQNEQQLFQQQEAAASDQQNAIPLIVKDVSLKSNNFVDKARSPDKLKQQNGSEEQHPPSTNRTVPENGQPIMSENVSPTQQNTGKSESWQQELQKVVQQIFVAQAQVQLEANQIERAQSIAALAQQSLEESAKNVRVITAALHAAQEKLATSALRAQTAQLQLAAHDQLLFTARQRVDALSAQMVGLQAQEGIVESKPPVDLPALLAKLKQPLPETLRPTLVPSILGQKSLAKRKEDLVVDGSGNVTRGMSIVTGDHMARSGVTVEKRSHPEGKTISKGDLRDLVKFILDKSPYQEDHSQDVRNPEGNIQNTKSTVSGNLQKAVDQKYFAQFLDNIRNIKLKEKPNKMNTELLSRPKGPSFENHILNLYESILKPSTIEKARKASDVVQKSDKKIYKLADPQKPGEFTSYDGVEQLDSEVGRQLPAFYYDNYPFDDNPYQRDK